MGTCSDMGSDIGAEVAAKLVLRSADLLALQSQVLEAVACGESVYQSMDLLCRRVEALAPDVRCSVLLLKGDRLEHGAAPSLPEVYTSAINGMRIGPNEGSCGAAAYTAQPVLAEDVRSDPRWAAFRHLALPHQLLACWSSPIIGREGQVLGTFALYYAEPSQPLPFHCEAVQAATHLAAIAIERHAMDLQEHARVDELQHSYAMLGALNAQLENRVSERTAVLDQRNAELTRTIEELQRTQSALIEARKLLSLGRLVAGVAHELNTPIGNARLFASSLKESADAVQRQLQAGNLRRSELERFIGHTCEAGRLLDGVLQGAVDLIASFKAIVVERDDAQRVSFQLSALVDNALLLIATPLRKSGCELYCDVPPQLMLDGYPAQLQQVLTCLLGNALQHGLADLPGGRLSITASMLDAQQLQILVCDNGHGIAPEYLSRVFDPFFTTRLGQGSSGLGLHVTYSLVTGLLGGHVWLSSEPGCGTTVCLHLPLRAPDHGLPQH